MTALTRPARQAYFFLRFPDIRPGRTALDARLDRSIPFSETFGRTDALYFTVTVLATVGFGDITPVTSCPHGRR